MDRENGQTCNTQYLVLLNLFLIQTSVEQDCQRRTKRVVKVRVGQITRFSSADHVYLLFQFVHGHLCQLQAYAMPYKPFWQEDIEHIHSLTRIDELRNYVSVRFVLGYLGQETYKLLAPSQKQANNVYKMMNQSRVLLESLFHISPIYRC